jgi:ferritin-like metal-binding protein YciE
MPEQTTADVKLVQYLNEAYGLEKQLETSLQAHLAMTTKPAYKKRLKEHLSETKAHARKLKQRIKQLGGVAETISAPGPEPIAEAAQIVLSGAQKAVALAQGPLHALRGTGEEERQLKNAKTEYASEAEEIATYIGIETLAETLGDKETQRLARSIRREEERMRSYLEKEIPRLTKAVAQVEIPASQRKKPSRARAAAAPRVKTGSTNSGKARRGSANTNSSSKAGATSKVTTKR